jgi:hypothetical protein
MKSSPETTYFDELTARENRLRRELEELDKQRDIVLRELGKCLVERMDNED